MDELFLLTDAEPDGLFNVQQLADPSQKLLDLYNFFPDVDKRLRQPGMTLLSVYNETLTRRDFIDPFLKTLGWDIENESGFAEAYRCPSPFPETIIQSG